VRRRFLPMIVVSVMAVGLASDLSAAPQAELWTRWQQHNAQNPTTIDFTFWQTFLERYLDSQHPSGVHRLRYGQVSPEDRQRLQHYLAIQQQVTISAYSPREQLAYWINLYNAATVSLILEHFPVASIRDIRLSGLFRVGPWQAKLLTIEGEPVSLDDIEHRIIRPIWRDNRVHYALNCASLGCPNLAPVVYTSTNLEALLDQGARAYINHPRGVFCQDTTCTVSSIYVWFQEDFGGTFAGVVQHLLPYANDTLATQLRAYRGQWKHRYDWRLNAPEVPGP